MSLTTDDFLNFTSKTEPAEIPGLGTVHIRQFSGEDAIRINDSADAGKHLNRRQLEILLSCGVCDADGKPLLTEEQAGVFLGRPGSNRPVQELAMAICRANGIGEEATAELSKNSETPADGVGSSA